MYDAYNVYGEKCFQYSEKLMIDILNCIETNKLNEQLLFLRRKENT